MTSTARCLLALEFTGTGALGKPGGEARAYNSRNDDAYDADDDGTSRHSLSIPAGTVPLADKTLWLAHLPMAPAPVTGAASLYGNAAHHELSVASSRLGQRWIGSERFPLARSFPSLELGGGCARCRMAIKGCGESV